MKLLLTNKGFVTKPNSPEPSITVYTWKKEEAYNSDDPVELQMTFDVSFTPIPNFNLVPGDIRKIYPDYEFRDEDLEMVKQDMLLKYRHVHGEELIADSIRKCFTILK